MRASLVGSDTRAWGGESDLEAEFGSPDFAPVDNSNSERLVDTE